MDLTAGERQAAREALRTGRPAPRPAEPDADLRFAFHPLASDRTPKGGAVVGVGRPLSPAPVEDAAVAAVLRHAGIALSRLAMAERANAARAEADRERVRNALLSSLSHDLRTPLATILGAATSLRELGPSMPEDARADLLEAIEDEARRLSRHVGDLLDMTRVEAGALVVKSDWTDLPDLVRTVADRARRAHPKFAIETATAAAMPLVRTDAGLVGQALFNLVDNAARHGGGHATLATGMAGREMSIVVTDDGPGLPPGARAALFTPFAAQGPRAGSGLGLAIARGMARALGGDVTCDSPVANGRGCRFTLTIPAGEGPSA